MTAASGCQGCGGGVVQFASILCIVCACSARGSCMNKSRKIGQKEAGLSFFRRFSRSLLAFYMLLHSFYMQFASMLAFSTLLYSTLLYSTLLYSTQKGEK